MSKPKVRYTIVAFRYDQKRSVLYKNTTDAHKIGVLASHALVGLDADVISIRRVYEERPILQKKIL